MEIVWNMKKRNAIFLVLLVLTLLFSVCIWKKYGTYLSFTVEGKEYRVDGVKLEIEHDIHHPGYYRFSLIQSPDWTSYQSSPTGHIFWIMGLISLNELGGKKINLREIQDEARQYQIHRPVHSEFTLDKEDQIVGPCGTKLSSIPSAKDYDIDDFMSVKIEHIDNNFIEASFSAMNYCYLSGPEKGKIVDVRGSFRARLKRLKTITDRPSRDLRFAIYLLSDPSIDAGKALKMDINSLPLSNTPLITASEIKSYDWDTHSFRLTPGLGYLIPPIDNVGVRGMPFVVTVKGKRIYLGAFWSELSSLGFPAPVIRASGYSWMSFKPAIDEIMRSTPGDSFATGPDPRGNPLIKEALKDAGKLAPGK